MKKWSVLLTFVMTLGVVSPSLAAVEVSGDAYVGISNMYLWRGFDLTSPNGDFVVQPGMDTSFGNFTVSYWSNYDEDLESVNETDITLDYSFDLSEMVSLSVGNIYYALEGAADTNELYLGVGLNTLLSPSLTIYYDYDEAEETGIFATLSVGHSFDLAEGLSLSLGAGASYNLESDYAVGNYSALHNGELSAGLDYALTDLVAVGLSAIFSTPLSNDAEEMAVLPVDDEVAVGLTLALGF